LCKPLRACVTVSSTPVKDAPIEADRNAWRRELFRRMRVRPVAKGLATTLGISAFFIAYFWVLHHPFSVPALMPVTALDRLIGFEPGALPLYFSLWLYVSIAPALLDSGRELAAYGLATLAISVVGLGIFMAWPTAVPPVAIDWSLHPSIEFLKDVDLAANACPSMHVAFAVLNGIWLDRLLREMRTGIWLLGMNWLWCIGILYSTLATRQHVVLDVLTGAALGALVAAVLGFARRAPLRRFATQRDERAAPTRVA
jgi:membrane-associated phospholipid phosphatase